MAQNKRVLTDAFLRAVQPTGIRAEVWDHGNPGFGIRIGVQGDVSFQYVYRIAGRSRRLTIGKFPAYSLSAARAAYERATIAVADGNDPAAEKLLREKAERSAITVQALCADFIERYAKQHKRTWQEDKRQLLRDVVPVMGTAFAKDITRKDINRLLDAKMDAGSPVSANRLLAVLSKAFGWAVERGEIEESPCTGVKKPAREVSRERVLQHPEILPLWYALDTGRGIGMHEVTRRALQLMLLTGQRKGEVLRMQWTDLEGSGTACVWTIPAANSKNGKAHRVPLVEEAQALLDTLRVKVPAADTEAKPPPPWCFPSPKKPEQHISLTTPDHALRDEMQQPESPLRDLGQFTPHDCRRTVATGLSVLGYPRLIVQKVLNHTDTSSTAVYDRYGYEKEKREALTKWADMLLAATWPAGESMDMETGETEYAWEYMSEWDRMKY
ncbi:MAG: tyrosine-type recombinase/integrase [Pseudomonadota bacterium]